MNRILIHVGPWSEEHYPFIAREMFPQAQQLILSGHPNCDKSGMFDGYYSRIKHRESDQNEASSEELDMILRCRLLRAIDRASALRHLRCMRDAIREVFDRFQPDMVFTECIDAYIMDLLWFEANARGIRFIGLVPNFIAGYFRITARGEYTKSRTVTDEEVEKVAATLLRNNYKPDFIKNNDSKLWIYALGRWVRNFIKIPYFTMKRLSPKERFNYHNWATLIVAKSWLQVFPRIRLGSPSWREQVLRCEKKIIYVPLQMIPEATVDYWCEDLEAVDYDNYLVGLVERLNEKFIVLIKEHPNVLGYRDRRIYRRLEKAGAVFAPSNENSQELVSLSDAILVWTGSVGFEAAIRGKPVLTTCHPYYAVGSNFKLIKLNTPLEEIVEFINKYNLDNMHHEQRQLLSHVLEGALPGRYIIDGSWTPSNEQHVGFAKNIAQQLRSYLAFVEN